MSDLALALGLVLAVEGTLYAVAPEKMRAMMRELLALPSDTLRMAGVVALAAGVGIVWLARGA